MVESRTRNPKDAGLSLSALSILNTTTEVPLSKAPNLQLLPGAPLHKWLPTAPGVCSQLCVHLDGLNAEHKFQVWVTVLGFMSLWLSISFFLPYSPGESCLKGIVQPKMKISCQFLC